MRREAAQAMENPHDGGQGLEEALLPAANDYNDEALSRRMADLELFLVAAIEETRALRSALGALVACFDEGRDLVEIWEVVADKNGEATFARVKPTREVRRRLDRARALLPKPRAQTTAEQLEDMMRSHKALPPTRQT